jgi:hypothetical protein
MNVIREQFAGAIETVRLRTKNEEGRCIGDLSSEALVKRLLDSLPPAVEPDPDDVADEDLEDAELADELARSPIAADRELSFLTMAVAALDEMGDFAAARCMAYLSNRYPPED